MGMTITEKILAARAGKKAVEPGELINARLDFVFGHELSGGRGVGILKEMGATRVFDPDRIALINDHQVPARDIATAEFCKKIRGFAREQGIKDYYEVGRSGIAQTLIPDKGLVVAGDVAIGGDSHTCTLGGVGAFATGVGVTDMAAGMAMGKLWFKVPESIKFIYYGKLRTWVTAKDVILHTIGDIGIEGARYEAMEFTGELVDTFSMADRFTMCNMAIEAGAKNGIVAPDDTTRRYLSGRARRQPEYYSSDPDATYARTYEYDVSKLEPLVALPPDPGHVKPVSDLSRITIDQVIVGSCTNGRIEDLRLAASILKGRQTHDGVRLIVVPAMQEIYRQAVLEGLIVDFLDAGAVISPPTCGACNGGHMGILAAGERALCTTNRNFVGRMGHPTSEVYLCNPAVAAASAITGRITHPGEVA